MKTFLIALLAIVAIYATSAFITLEINPLLWSETARATSSIFTCIAIFMAIFWVAIDLEE